MPWRKIVEPSTLRDLDLSGVRNYFDTIYSISGNTKIEDALMIDFDGDQLMAPTGCANLGQTVKLLLPIRAWSHPKR